LRVKKYQAHFQVRLDVQFEFEAADENEAQDLMDTWQSNGAEDIIARGTRIDEDIDSDFWVKKKPALSAPDENALRDAEEG
jgi:hypothetical protein